MRTEDIIKSLNNHIENIRKINSIKTKSHLVLHKKIAMHSVFKIYKTYTYTLYLIKDSEQIELLSIDNTERVTAENEEAVVRDMDMKFLTLIFNWIGTEEYNQVISNTYK